MNIRLIRIDDDVKLPKLSTVHARYTNNAPSQHQSHQSGGVKNSVALNPFSPFNSVETATAHRRKKVPKFGFARNENFFHVKFGDFNGLRITKNVSYNISTFH